MKHLCTFLILTAMGSLFGAADSSVPPFVGDWRGTWLGVTRGFHADSPQLTAQVIGLGDNEYRVVFRGEFQRRAEPIFEGTGRFRDGRILIYGQDFNCRITDSEITGEGIYKTSEPTRFALRKFTHVSPTMGRAAPEGALVLFDGTSLDAWKHVNAGVDQAPAWRIVDGVLETVPRRPGEMTGGNLVSRQVFKSCELHLEFWLPFEPDRRGQGRSNSGVFLQGIYEVQILDSFGLVGDWTECGALYKVSPPKVNRAAPPGQWQTFDIIYDAPLYGEAGQLLRDAVMTVRHNGELIHNQQELFEVTYYTQKVRLLPPPREAAPIFLQDHGHPVRFRNIWILGRE